MACTAQGWALTPGDVTDVPWSAAELLFSPNSAPVVITKPTPAGGEEGLLDLTAAADPATQDETLPASTLNCFEAVSLQVSSKTAGEGSCVDALLCTGGLVWAAAFCPLGSPLIAVQAADRDGQGCGWPAAAQALQQGEAASRTDLLALAVHPAGHTRHTTGQLLSGPGAVQVWAVPQGPQSSLSPDGVPRCALLLAHAGLLTWDVQWCPEPWLLLRPDDPPRPPRPQGEAQPAEPARAQPEGHLVLDPAINAPVGVVGVLATALGDGSVQVVCVPSPQDPHLVRLETVTARDASLPGTSAPPQAISVVPHVVLTPQMLGGGGASCVSWCHGKPRLLVGCWDGSISVWQLPNTAARPWDLLMVTCCIRADVTPVRRVQWCPNSLPAPPTEAPTHPESPSPQQAEAEAEAEGLGPPPAAKRARGAPHPSPWLHSLDDAPAHQFMSAHQSGYMRIWDVRDPLVPVMAKLVHRSATYDATWVVGPPPSRHTLISISSDGALRTIELTPTHYAADAKNSFMTVAAGVDTACMWGVAYSPDMQSLAVVGEDGLAFLQVVECQPDTRNRRPHVPLGGLVSVGGLLHVVGPRQVAGIPSAYPGGSMFGMPHVGFVGQQAGQKGWAATSELRDVVQTMYCVAWSPNVQGEGDTGPADSSCTWLAFGGQAGLVRCMRLHSGI